MIMLVTTINHNVEKKHNRTSFLEILVKSKRTTCKEKI